MTSNDRVEEYQAEVAHYTSHKWGRGKAKYGDSWLGVEPEYLIRRMEEELYEFRQAVEHDRDEQAALREVADIVNFGLMFLALNDMKDTDTDP